MGFLLVKGKKHMKVKKKTWPPLGRLVLRDKIFGIRKKSSLVWVDGHPVLYGLIHDLSNISRSSEHHENAMKEAEKLVESYNNGLKSRGFDFIKIYRPQEAHFTEKYKYLIILKTDFEKLDDFLEKLARDQSKSLDKKYEYLSASRLRAIEIFQRGGFFAEFSPIKDIQKGVKKMVRGEIKQISKTFEATMRTLDNVQRLAEKKYRRRIQNPLFFFVLPEIITTLEACKTLSEKGLITSVYREFRKILEISANSIFVDLLFRDVLSIWKKLKIDHAPWVERKFFNAAKSSGIEQIRNIYDFRRGVNNLFKQAKMCFEVLDKEITKEKFYKNFTRQLSYPLFMIVFGTPDGDIKGKEISEYIMKKEMLEGPAIKNFARILSISTGKGKETKKEIRVAKAILDTLYKEKNQIIPPPITITFYMQYAKEMSGISFYDIYSDYSMFVHTYLETLQVLPFSSVFEFKILREETKKFANFLKEITKWYSFNVFQI